MKYYIVTFGCAANVLDGKQIEAYYETQGYIKTSSIASADEVIIVTCMIRESAEARVYGLIRNLSKKVKHLPRIIITGCMVGMMLRDATGKLKRKIEKRIPMAEFIPVEELGLPQIGNKKKEMHALVHISNGCNNYCSYCVVPYARGQESSRPYEEIIAECKKVVRNGCQWITLIGQNVNSYGVDIVKNRKITSQYKNEKITYVMHLGKMRIPTLFPKLLSEVSKIKGLKKVDFISSNPWDFSDDLIEVIADHDTVSHTIHLPVQSGDDAILHAMNRWYTKDEYIKLITKIRKKIPDVKFSTDIIVGFPGETKEQFEHTVDLCKKVGFVKAYISKYSDRPMTLAHKTLPDDINPEEKKRRWRILEDLINAPNKHTNW